MYRKLLEDLIYYHSTKELHDRFNQKIYRYKKDNPVLIIGDDHKVFGIGYYDYSYQNIKDLDKLFAGELEKWRIYSIIYPLIETEFHINEDTETGTVDSIFSIVFDYNLLNIGFSILEQTMYIILDDRLILLYKYHHIYRACTFYLSNKIINCSNQLAFRLIQNLKIPSICMKKEVYKQLRSGVDGLKERILNTITDPNVKSCICGPNVFHGWNSRFYICVGCPNILKIRLSKIFTSLNFLLNNLDIPDDIKKYIKEYLYSL